MTSTDFQKLAGEQGKKGEEIAKKKLREAGFVIKEIHVSIEGVEINIEALNKHNIPFHIQVKASWRGERPGLRRTDSLSKAVGEAYMIDRNGLPGWIMFMTSHNPISGRGVEKMRLLERKLVFDSIEFDVDDDRLHWIANATGSELEEDIKSNPNLWHTIAKRRSQSGEYWQQESMTI